MPAAQDLRAVDAVEIFVLVENYVDVLLPGSDVVTRPVPRYEAFAGEQFRAEHGSAFVVIVEDSGSRSAIVYDAGVGRDTAVHNLRILDLTIPDLRAIVLSHGHTDHHGGLEGMVREVGRRGLPLVLHPDAWRDREVRFPTGTTVHLPPPSRNDLEREGVAVLEEREPTLLIDGRLLVTGQVDRHTAFEKGMPTQFARAGDGWEPDPWVWDDQAVVAHVRGRGLVVLSGCSHAGAINVLRHARQLTGVDRVHAFIGGLHLSSGDMQPAISPTVQELIEAAPDHLVPGHCTGPLATRLLASALPDAFTVTSVGSRLRFAAP